MEIELKKKEESLEQQQQKPIRNNDYHQKWNPHISLNILIHGWFWFMKYIYIYINQNCVILLIWKYIYKYKWYRVQTNVLLCVYWLNEIDI